ncbi:MAG: Ig-like domain-containing protein [Prevotellaceae bacterium]|jgi:hypothetical protein|nr:Ig-like domain-containing protein [Prevotellaceae bacterium]
MKLKNISLIAMAIAAVMMVSCNPSQPSDATITLDKQTVSVAVGKSVKINATVTPADAKVTWSVEDSEIAMVTNGMVVGKKVGSTRIIAANGSVTAECAVTVTPGETVEPTYAIEACLQGNNYFPLILDQGALDYLSANGKTVTWIGPNGPGTAIDDDGVRRTQNSQNLWFWDESVGVGTQDGLNFFNAQGYLCLTRLTYGWGGFAIAAPDAANPHLETVTPIDMSDVYAHPNQYYFHVALKQLDPSFAVTLQFSDGLQNGKKQVSFTFGNVAGDNGQVARAAIPQDGMWHEFEIPCTEFVVGDQMMYQNAFYDANVMAFGIYPGDVNATLHIDAAFFYKK